MNLYCLFCKADSLILKINKNRICMPHETCSAVTDNSEHSYTLMTLNPIVWQQQQILFTINGPWKSSQVLPVLTKNVFSYMNRSFLSTKKQFTKFVNLEQF